MVINNPLMIIVSVEEVINKNYTWENNLIKNNREAPREAPKKIQHKPLVGAALR